MYDISDDSLRCGGSLPVGEIWKSRRGLAAAAAAETNRDKME